MRTSCANVIPSKLFPLYVINKLSQVVESHFGMPLKIQVKLILNCPRAHAIIYTKHRLISLTQLTTGVLIGQRFMAYCTDKLGHIITGNHAFYDEGLKFDHSIRIYGFIN